MTATEMKPRMTAGLFCVCSMALQPSLYVAGWNPLPGLVMPVASGWQQPAAHRRVAQTALTRVGGPEIRAVRMSTKRRQRYSLLRRMAWPGGSYKWRQPNPFLGRGMIRDGLTCVRGRQQ